MARKSFSFKNILLGVFLGITTVAGWAFYPQIESAVQGRAPVAMAKLLKIPAAESPGPEAAAETTVSFSQDEAPAQSLPDPPPEPISAENAVAEPVLPPAPEANPKTAAKEARNILDASPGWNPEMVKAMLDNVQAPPPADTREASPPDAQAEMPTVGLDPPQGEPSTRTSPAQHEEALWQTLLASPFFADRAEGYPYAACFKSAAEQTLLPLPLLLGLGAYLSNFEADAVDADGLGILQVGWPRPARSLGIEARETLLGDPCQNISAGSRHLASLLTRSQGQWVPALAAYRRRSEPAYLGRLRPEDIRFSRNLRGYVGEVIQQPYRPKTLYAFWQFDERITAKRFMEMVEQQSGVQLRMGQQGFGYVIYIPAADPEERMRKLQVIEKETGLQSTPVGRQDTPS